MAYPFTILYFGDACGSEMEPPSCVCGAGVQRCLPSNSQNVSRQLAGFHLDASGPSRSHFGHMQFQDAILQSGCRLGCIHFSWQFERA